MARAKSRGRCCCWLIGGSCSHRSTGQALGQVDRPVGEDRVGAGPLDAEDALVRLAASRSIQPFAAAAWIIAYSPQIWYAQTGTVAGRGGVGEHVEVAHRGLDHDDVGALVEVEGDLAQALAAVAVVHLVGAAVADERRLDGLAERAVEGADAYLAA